MAAYVDPMMAPLPQGYGQSGKDQGKDHDGQTASMQSSTELTSAVSLQTLSLLDSLDEALGGLESEHVHDRAVAARQLGKLVEGAYGEDAAAAGAYVRDSGAIEMLLELVADPVPDVHQKVLMVLGNLVSDAVDHQSWRTKQVIVELQGVDYFIPHLSDTDWVTQMYAAACIQNMCQNVEFASSLKGRGALQPLRNLLRSTQLSIPHEPLHHRIHQLVPHDQPRNTAEQGGSLLCLLAAGRNRDALRATSLPCTLEAAHPVP